MKHKNQYENNCVRSMRLYSRTIRDHNPTKNFDYMISEKRDFKDLRVEEFKDE